VVLEQKNPGWIEQRKRAATALELVTAEELILVALGAVGALKAADKQNRYTERDQNGQHTRVRADEMSYRVHIS